MAQNGHQRLDSKDTQRRISLKRSLNSTCSGVLWRFPGFPRKGVVPLALVWDVLIVFGTLFPTFRHHADHFQDPTQR